VAVPSDDDAPATASTAQDDIDDGDTTAAVDAPATTGRDDESSVTATSQDVRRAVSALLPLTIPGAVQIREMGEEDDADEGETEVRTLVDDAADLEENEPTKTATKELLVAGAEDLRDGADAADESITTQAPRSDVAEDEPRTEVTQAPVLPPDPPEPPEPPAPPAVLPPPRRAPVPAAGRPPPAPAREALVDDAYQADESVTTRAPVVSAYSDESVTALSPVVPPARRAPRALPDETDGTTKKVARRGRVRDEEPSITPQASGHLTHMLRIIAAAEEPLPAVDPLEEDDAENRTALMAQAPEQPGRARSLPSGPARAARPQVLSGRPSGASRAAAIADLRADVGEVSSSDSGLRIAQAEAPSADHASAPGPIRVDPAGRPPSGGMPVNAFARTEYDVAPPRLAEPVAVAPLPLRQIEFGSPIQKGPRYGLMVAVVAMLSFLIPVGLFLWLRPSEPDVPSPPPSEVATDHVGRGDPPRARASASARPSAAPPPPPPHVAPAPAPKGPWSTKRK
jgi:hypothetical protein